MHGVSAMRGGERCAFLILILFLKVLTTAPPPLTSPSRSPHRYALILFFFREYRTMYDSATVRGNSGKREESE